MRPTRMTPLRRLVLLGIAVLAGLSVYTLTHVLFSSGSLWQSLVSAVGATCVLAWLFLSKRRLGF